MPHSAFLIAFFITIVRYYDYALFGLSAGILAQNFLPMSNETTQLLSFFAIISGTVIARPFGSLIFGFIGDKYGRVKSVKISMLISCIATSLIAMTPNFEKIGFFATIILIFCRMMFLISLAGEVDGVKIYVAEKADKKQKNLVLGIVASCSQIGALLAAILYYFASYESSYTYLWRFNFLVGAVLGIIGILLRGFLKESSEFLKHQKKHATNVTKDLKIFYQAKLFFFLAILISGSIGGIYHFLVIFLGVFLSQIVLIMSNHNAQIMNIALIVTYAFSAILAGLLADKINPIKQIIFALLSSLAIALFMEILLYYKIFRVCFPIVLIGLAAFYTVPIQIIIQSLFKPLVKMRLYSLSHSLGGIFLSSSTPFFSMLLWQHFESLQITFAFFIALLVILTSAVMTLIYFQRNGFR